MDAPTTDVFGTWLSYSAEHDVLVEAGRVARDTLSDEPKGMRAYRRGSGKVLWYKQTLHRPGDDPRRHDPEGPAAPATC